MLKPPRSIFENRSRRPLGIGICEEGMGEKSQPCHFCVIFALYNYAERALLLEQVVRVFSFLFFFKAKIIFICSEVVPRPPQKLFLFFFPFLWSAVSQNIVEVCAEVTGEDASGTLG